MGYSAQVVSDCVSAQLSVHVSEPRRSPTQLTSLSLCSNLTRSTTTLAASGTEDDLSVKPCRTTLLLLASVELEAAC